MASLWKRNEENLRKETKVGAEKITKPGAYDLTVKDCYIRTSNSSHARAFKISFEGDEGAMNTSIWFENGKGEPNEFGQIQLDKFLYLLKLNPENLKDELREVNDFGGNKIKRVYFPEVEGKKIGVCTVPEEKEYNGNTYYDYVIHGFYDIKSGKTADEIINKTQATFKDEFIERYVNCESTVSDTESQEVVSEKDDNDEFPF